MRESYTKMIRLLISVPNFMWQKLFEKRFYRKTEKEVPHTVTCYVESLEEEDDLVSIQVCIVVERDNLKKIIIGKRGSMLKRIGSEARKDLEEYFSKKYIYRRTSKQSIIGVTKKNI